MNITPPHTHTHNHIAYVLTPLLNVDLLGVILKRVDNLYVGQKAVLPCLYMLTPLGCYNSTLVIPGDVQK